MPSSPNAAAKIQYFTDDTLFYIFYAFPRDSLQEMAALQLYGPGDEGVGAGGGVGGSARGTAN